MSGTTAVNPETIIRVLTAEIDTVFTEAGSWFLKKGAVRTYRATAEEWNIDRILEHISLVNHYLLILIDKGARKALKRADKNNIEQALEQYELTTPVLEDIGINNSFAWKSPRHMVPSGTRSPKDIREDLLKQRSRLIDYLQMLKNGEGVLYKTAMSVHSLGKLDVYQYIYFLLKHMRRHIQQMEGIEGEFNKTSVK